MLRSTAKYAIKFGNAALFTIALLIINGLSGCTAYDKLQKSHEALATLQEADRQFSIEDTADGAAPDDREALKWIARAIALMPHSPIPYTGDGTDPGIVQILQNRGRYPLMITLLKKALQDPALSDDPDLLLNLADAEERFGPSPEATQNYAKADAAINKSLTTAGSTIDTDGSLLLNRARAEYYGGMRPQGLKDFNTLIATKDDYTPEAENDLAYFEALDKSNLPQAKQLATSAVAAARSMGNDDPTLGMYDDTLAWVDHQQGDNSDALLYEEEAASLDPLVPDIQFHLGEICKASGRYYEAHFAYRAAVKLDPFYPGAKQSLSDLPPVSAG